MIQWFFTHQLVVPAKRAIATPFIQAKVLEDAILNRMQVRVPPGHVGLTGFAIWWSGVQLWPSQPGSWLLGDNETVEWTPNIEVTQGGLQMVGYNLDKFAHTFYAKFWLTAKAPATSPVVIASPQLSPLPPDTAGVVARLAGTVPTADLVAAAQASPDLASEQLLAGVS